MVLGAIKSGEICLNPLGLNCGVPEAIRKWNVLKKRNADDGANHFGQYHDRSE